MKVHRTYDNYPENGVGFYYTGPSVWVYNASLLEAYYLRLPGNNDLRVVIADETRYSVLHHAPADICGRPAALYVPDYHNPRRRYILLLGDPRSTDTSTP